MSDILKVFSEPALVDAIKINFLDWVVYVGPSPKMHLVERPDLRCYIMGYPGGLFNGVFHARLAPEKVDETIEEMISHFSSRDVSPFSWWIESDTQPPDLDTHLERHGFRFHALRGMAMDLEASGLNLPALSHLDIQVVDGEERLEQWDHAIDETFGLSDFAGFYAGLGFDLPLRSYVGYLRGKPVATSCLFLSAGVAGIYCVGTVPEARGQGIGTAIASAPLLDAREQGYRFAILHSSPMAYNMYRRIGFQEYCKVGYYIWEDERKRSEEKANDA